MRLKLLHRLHRVIDQGEAGRFSATVLGAEGEDLDVVLGCLVELRELAAELIFGNVGAVRMEHVAIWWG